MKIRVEFLGTGTSQGVPVIGCHCEVCRSADARDNRLRTSVAIDVDGLSLVVDASMDFRAQMLRSGIERLDAILMTHEHRDHVGGLDDVRAFNYFQKRDTPVYCTEVVAQNLRQVFDYAFAEKRYPGVPEIELNIIENKPFEINGLRVLPIEGQHYVFKVFGYRIGDFAYLTDFNGIEQVEKEKLKGLKVLVVNSLRRQKHVSHYNLEQALELISEVNPQKAYLTHISHQMGLHETVLSELPQNVALAYDGLVLEL